MTTDALRLKLLGVGAMASPKYAPAGLLVFHAAGNVMLDGGPEAEPEPPLAAWLVTDLRGELIAQIRRLARAQGLEPAVQAYKDVESALRDVVVGRQLKMVHELKERMGQGHSMAIGVSDVADAFVRGQVDQLLLDPEAAADFTLRPSDHPGLPLGIKIRDEDLRADQALMAAACLTDADIAVATAATMGGAPVAALLRWNQ